MAKNTTKKETHNTFKPTARMSTYLEDVVAELQGVCMSELFPEFSFKDKVVIAKDDNGMYLTGKSYVGTKLLDPYKMYRRIEVIAKDGEYFYEGKK